MKKLFFLFVSLLLSLGLQSPAEQATTEPSVVVQAADPDEFEEPGGYGQPQWAERSQVSSTTKLYVLSPYEVFLGFFFESDFFRHGKSFHDLSQEIEVGLPYRFEIGIENHLGLSGSHGQETLAAIETRYALAKWGALPLNPAISAAYHFGIGNRPRTQFSSSGNQPDSYELRILLGQEFFPRFQWAFNGIFQQELSGFRNRELGFTQDITYTLIPDRLDVGAEMRYRHDAALRGSNGNEFILGPSVSWKPNRYTVIDLAPLFGCTKDSPTVAAFVTVSFEFGGAESRPRVKDIRR